MTGYDLSRNWFDWCFENPEKISPNHTAMYFFIIEHCNRLGWKEKFGLPTTMVKDAIGIKSYNTYKNTLNDLVEFGFIKMIEVSKNQYSSNIIALSNFNKTLDNARNKALDKATLKHLTKQSESTSESIDSIDKPITIEPLTNKPITIEEQPAMPPPFSFEKSLLNYGFEKQLVSDWLKVRKTKRGTNTKTAFDDFIKTIEELVFTGREKNDILRIMVKKSWVGLEVKWIENLENENSNHGNQKNNGNFANGNGTKLGTSEARIAALRAWGTTGVKNL